MGRRLAYATAVGWSRRRREHRVSPLQVGGLELTPVARESALGVRLGPVAAVTSRLAPSLIEVRHADGRRERVRVTDIHSRMRAIAAMLGALSVVAMIVGRLR